MQSSLGYILRTRPYSDANMIVDLFTKEAGRITCMARPARLRGKVQKGHLQSFRILQLDWQGRGEMPRLNQTDERFRHRIPVANLLYGLYLNELILRLIPQHSSLETLYRDYENSLQLLVQSNTPKFNRQLKILWRIKYCLVPLWAEMRSRFTCWKTS